MQEHRTHVSSEVVQAWSSIGSDFDVRIEAGEFDALEREPLAPYQQIAGNHTYVTQEYRKHMKYIALPMHRRAWNEQRTVALADHELQKQEMDISSTYSEYTDLMQHIMGQLPNAAHHRDYFNNLRGVLTEATVMSLFARTMTGAEDDAYIAMPSDNKDDIGPIEADGIHTGFDVRVINRNTFSHLKVQVKTSAAHLTGERYQSDILILILERIAGGRENIPKLQQALIGEVAGHASETEHALVNSASNRLTNQINRAFNKLHKRHVRRPGGAAVRACSVQPPTL